MSRSKEKEFQDTMKIMFYVLHSVRQIYTIFNFEAKKAKFCRVCDVFLTTGGPIHGVSSRTLGQASRVRFLHQNREKERNLYEHICLQTESFVVQPSRPPDLSSLHFYLWGHVNTQVYSSVIENGQTLHQSIIMSVKSFAVIRCAHACIEPDG